MEHGNNVGYWGNQFDGRCRYCLPMPRISVGRQLAASSDGRVSSDQRRRLSVVPSAPAGPASSGSLVKAPSRWLWREGAPASALVGRSGNERGTPCEGKSGLLLQICLTPGRSCPDITKPFKGEVGQVGTWAWVTVFAAAAVVPLRHLVTMIRGIFRDLLVYLDRRASRREIRWILRNKYQPADVAKLAKAFGLDQAPWPSLDVPAKDDPPAPVPAPVKRSELQITPALPADAEQATVPSRSQIEDAATRGPAA